MLPRETSLSTLDPRFYPIVVRILSKLTEARIPVIIIETYRSEEAHKEDLKTGHSWVQHSKHQDGLAVDICPFESYQLHGSNKLQWDSNDPIWEKIGLIGESCGAIWGGRWQHKDMGHFEFKEN